MRFIKSAVLQGKVSQIAIIFQQLPTKKVSVKPRLPAPSSAYTLTRGNRSSCRGNIQKSEGMSHFQQLLYSKY